MIQETNVRGREKIEEPGSKLTHLHELTISAITTEKTKAKTEKACDPTAKRRGMRG